MSKKSPKKTTSFRIEPKTLKGMERASIEDNITLNTLVNHVLAEYLSWERPSLKSGWIAIKNEVVKAMMNKLEDKEIQRLAVDAAREVTKDTLLSMTGSYDLKNWLFVTRMRSIKSGFHYQETQEDGMISIIIKHNMGLKWSLYHKWYYGTMIRDLKMQPRIDYTDKTLVVKVKT